MTVASPSLQLSPNAAHQTVATFWHGPALARLDVACLLSFVHAGFEVVVYGYEPVVGLPSSVAFRDAAEITDRRFLSSFIVKGKPSLQHFSDLFRYRLFLVTGAAWVDMDLLCIRPFSLPADANFIAKERPDSISNSILRIRMDQPELKTIVDEAERFGNGQEFAWGSTGPALLTRTFGTEVLRTALEPHHFFPVPWDEWWKPFTPSARAECDVACKEASAIHLWNNIVERSGYWKDIAPPRGSFLHAVLERNDCLSLFSDVYPASVMEHIAQNYRNSRTAAHMTVRELASITVPRALTAARKRITGQSG